MKSEQLIGRTIAGKYLVEALVGQGAMGCVYRARQLTLDTTLALKVLHRQLAGEPMFAARFLREAQAASRVDHPNSMRVIDFGEEPDGLLYIAMEYVDGKTLARIIEQDAPLPLARIVDIASQALAALAVAHDLGVVHRDLKPENIMVQSGADDEGRTHDIVKVCDFGVAKLLEGGARGPGVTAQGVVVGTPEYMSPEQARGDELDARSDIYAMGVLLFQLMTGQVPFDSSTAFGTALMHVNDEPTRPRILNPKASARLEAICLKAMRKRPDDRYPSARALRADLRALVGHEDDEAEENAMSHRSESEFANDGEHVGAGGPGSLLAQIDGRPRRSGLVMAAVVIASTALAGAYLYSRPAPPKTAALTEPVQTASGLPTAATVTAPPATAAPMATVAESTPKDEDKPVPSNRAHAAARANARHGKGHAGAPGAAAPPIAIGEEGPAPDAAKAAPSSAKAAPSPGPKADPADAPLPVFPIPSPEPAAPKAEPAAPKSEPAAPKAEPAAPKAEPAPVPPPLPS